MIHWLVSNTATALYSMLVVAVVGAIGTFLLRRYSSWGTPALYGLAAFTLLCVSGLATISTVSELSQMRQPHITPGNVEENVRKWLDNFQLSTKPLTKPEAPNSIFALQVTTDSGLPITVACPQDLPRYLVLQVSITLSPEHRAMFSKLTEEQESDLERDLRHEMAKCAVPCVIVGQLEKVAIQRRLAITDGLTEDAFMEHMDEMAFAFVVANDTIVRNLERMSGRRSATSVVPSAPVSSDTRPSSVVGSTRRLPPPPPPPPN
jgi:hypothetical protein